MRGRFFVWAAVGAAIMALVALIAYFAVRAGYPRPYYETVEGSGQEPALIYAVMKAESGFREDAVSEAGAVGVMQLLPATAQFVCARDEIAYEPERLKEGEYNTLLGCKYLEYLRGRFSCTETALAAYNAGEGTVSRWLSDPNFSADGATLKSVPYAETREYLKKIAKFRKIYEFFYGKT